MLASTRDDVALLNQLAQRQLMGERHRGRLMQFDIGTQIGAGDRIITRRNDRRLALSGNDWVKNGDRWTVDEVRRDGSLVVISERSGRRTTLPANYACRACLAGLRNDHPRCPRPHRRLQPHAAHWRREP